MSKREYDSTVARIAGNILSGMFDCDDTRNYTDAGLLPSQIQAVGFAVAMARLVVAETKQTEPRDIFSEREPG